MRNSNFIFIPGMYGMVGSSLYRYLTKKNKYFLHSRHVDFLNKSLLHDILKTTKIEKVFLCAAKVGGIEANSKYPLTFLNKNIVLIQNLIHELYNNNCNNLIYFGSSCIFPKKAPQPMKEIYLFKGLLEPTNEAYSLAKLIGLKLCEYYKKQLGVDYNTVIPSSLFGRGDNYNLKFAHVIPSVLKKIYVHKISNLNSFYV
ncbi:NAD-dependent epimerase/dehydratase family protein [Candidatus Pinguicoccus supinus]|uniref:NAD-dependent epimerase/dehydratase family protein n=1 Tax=Candidatus Pinguicoccus supinus TaxID=2529394 RepID=A0A7T0BRA5_9BACT|nr:NAD-dependent epimerase/dehydratase family protein [Candidatus Pinguicoccus supinus]